MIRRFRGLLVIIRAVFPVILVIGLALSTWLMARAVVSATQDYGDRLSTELNAIGAAVDEANDAFSAAQTGRIPPESRLYTDDRGQPVLLKKRLIVSGDQLIGASSGFDQQNGQPQVSVTLDGVGAKRMLDFTRDNVGNRMAVVYIEQKPGGAKTEEVISVAVVREPFGKRFQTTGLDSMSEASQLALLLRAGALAAPMEIVEERTVGPSLGRDNVEQGFKSVVIGFILVLVFMAAYYRVF